MKTLLKCIDVIYKNVTENDYDEVLAIMGDEGKGKTNVGLWIVEYWLSKRYGEVKPEMAGKHIALDSNSFASVLSKLQRFDIACHDEAADLSARGAMKKQNRMYVEAYQIIRGDNLCTILIIPSIFDLDGFFRKRRVRHLINVYARGRIQFWSKKRLSRMVEINERLPFKNVMLTRPTFYDTVPKYEGVLLPEYRTMKAEKMQGVRSQLGMMMKALSGPGGMMQKHQKVLVLAEEGLSQKEIGERTGYTRARVGQILKSYT